jgi:hypothetical protein
MTFLKKNNKLRDRLAMREAPKQFSEEETEKYRETINQENDSSLRMLPLIGAPLSALIVAAQAVMDMERCLDIWGSACRFPAAGAREFFIIREVLQERDRHFIPDRSASLPCGHRYRECSEPDSFHAGLSAVPDCAAASDL